MKKQISLLKSHYIICGFGRVGTAAAEYFKKAGAGFVIIENNPVQCRDIRKRGYLYIEGDPTHENVLLETGIKSAMGLLALLNSDPDNLFVVLTARELNPTLHIIARAEEPASEKKIFRAGADGVISPFATAGSQIASDILALSGNQGQTNESSVRPKAIPQWITVQEGSGMPGKTVSTVSCQMGKAIIGIRRNGRDSIFPGPETELEGGDMLLTADEKGDDENHLEQREPERQKLVIVDDNPVILRLYGRLFQRAGFCPLTATNGQEGLDVIIRERPVAAVVDYMLPILSGIEVCRRLRETEECQGVKLVLFTSDNQPETRKRGLEAGADAVVIKSPEASEVIETVLKVLEGEQSPVYGKARQ
jgi:voltage-gated potassium channel